ncbi:hypothetical protein Tco_0900972 [Tanacetum coccineum]
MPSPPSLLPFLSRKRSRSPPPPPLPSPLPTVLLPPPEVVIPERTATVRLQEDEPRYEMGENSLAQIHPIISEPIHHTIPLLVARLVHHDDQTEEIRNHQREILAARSESDVRIEILEQELETVRSRAEASEAQLQQSEADMRELMAHIRILEDRFGM